MTVISVKAFGGIKPIQAPRLLQNSEAQTAKNVRLISGNLSPLRTVSTLKASVLSAPGTIYKYGSSVDNESQYWLEFQDDVDVMRSPIASDDYERLYWTRPDARPRYAPNSLIVTDSLMPGASYELGIPKPGTAPVMSGFATVPVYTVVTREYVMTFYDTEKSVESAPSEVLSVQAVDGQTVAFKDLTTDNQGHVGITKKRIYRKVTDVFRLVTELDLATTTYDDTATDASLVAATALATALSGPPAPQRAPTVTAPHAGDISPVQARSYVYTVCNILLGGGESDWITYTESAPSAVRTVDADGTQTVHLAGLTTMYSGTAIKIYRKDPDSAVYKFIAQIPSNQTTYDDVIAESELGNQLEYDGPTATVPSQPTATVSDSTYTSTVKRIYMVTFLDADDKESGKSPVSTVVTVNDGVTTVTIGHSETLPTGVQKKRIYRQTVTIDADGDIVSSDANWHRVAEITASTTSTTDTKTEATVTAAPTYSAELQDLPPSPDNPEIVATATIPPKEVNETRSYVYTYVSAYGEEGPPSDASDVVEVDPTEAVTISMDGPPGGNYNITLKRIYRSSTVGNRAQFQFVAEVDIADLSYEDSVTQEDLGEILPSEGWNPPPVGLKGLRLMANGAAVGFVDRTIHFSEPNLPHAWPHQYTVDEDIVAIATYGQTVAVLTKAYPYLLQGIDPSAMASTKLPLALACSSKRSVVETGDGVVYASPDGLVSVGASVGVITQNNFSRDLWNNFYQPGTMQAYQYNGRIIILYTDVLGARGALIFDVSGQGALITTSDLNAASRIWCGYHDPKTGTLYFAQGNNIVRFDSSTNMTMTWRSKVYRQSYEMNFSVGQLIATGYPMTLKVYADGVLKHTQTVANSKPFRLPSGFRGRDWEFQIEGTNDVTEVAIATSPMELQTV